MEQLKVIKWLVGRLEKAGIEYFITGSIASTYYGIPRFTHDIDIVVTIAKQRAEDVIQLFTKYGYISREGILEALTGTGMFNFIHDGTGMKVDFWINQGDPFAKSCFRRARKVEITKGFFAVMASPEDVLLHKVYWNKLAPSERQIRDARGIIVVQEENLDRAYIAMWAEKLNIEHEVRSLFTQRNLPNLK